MITNLRDVGESVNIIHGKEIMKEGVLYRGGSVNDLFDKTELPNVVSIVNLRTGPDKIFKGINQIHVPAIDTVENYQTSNGRIRNWANRVIAPMISEDTFPCLIHCTSGKDRTGVIVALILLCIGIKKEIIVQEYLLSQGIDNENNINIALQGIDNTHEYIYEKSASKILQKKLLRY